jgi:hypothetical protein
MLKTPKRVKKELETQIDTTLSTLVLMVVLHSGRLLPCSQILDLSTAFYTISMLFNLKLEAKIDLTRFHPHHKQGALLL